MDQIVEYPLDEGRAERAGYFDIDECDCEKCRESSDDEPEEEDRVNVIPPNKTTRDKYIQLLELIDSMDNEDNYYATFALFGDSIPDDVMKDVKKIHRC